MPSGTGISTPKADGSGPVVVGANWYRFRPGELIHHRHVASVSFVWATQGGGTIRSGGGTHRMTPGTIVRLPWRHEVEYRADTRAPFQVGTLHMVPEHATGHEVEPRVAFLPDDPLLDVPWRHGPQEEAAVQLPSSTAEGRALIALAGYCVERFLDPAPVEPVLRALGVLIDEADRRWQGAASEGPARPPTVELMMEYVASHLADRFAVADVAAAGGCSAATAERLFAKHTGQSVVAWVRARRMEEAAVLLRTSGLRVNEVARRVGFADPLYFSKVFSATHSVPPSRYAAGQLRP